MASNTKKIILLFFLVFIAAKAPAQITIEGVVENAETGEPLPAANIIIQNVYQGTISNRVGYYRLSIPDSLLPVTVEVSFIGFHSEKRIIRRNSSDVQNFALKPSVAQLQALTVTAEGSDLSIMERVIRRKQAWSQNLQTYQADAYSRQILSNDTAIVSITESVSHLFWDDEKGHREVLKWRGQTANIEADENFAGVGYLPNLYSDNIEIAGFNMVGVTHPEALSYYNFEILDTLSIDEQAVFKIKVIPDRNLQPLFKGTVFVLDEEFALLRVNLTPNDVVRFPTPIKDFELNYRQQFNNFGGNFWLPVNVNINGNLKIKMFGLEFPRMQFRQVARITNYKVNTSLPDSFYEDEDLFTIDSTFVTNDSLFIKSIERVPLSPREETAYATIDSTETLEEAFKPSGFLARFMDDEENDTTDSDGINLNIPGSLSPRMHYNRVDGFYGGLNYEINPVDPVTVKIEGGYSTAYETWSYGGGIEYRFEGSRFNPKIGVSYRANTATRYSSLLYNPTMTTPVNLLGYPNYFDYFRNEGFKFYAELSHPETDLSLDAAFLSKNQTSLMQQTAYDILGRNRIPRQNPGINEGHLNAVNVKLGYNLDETYSFGVVGLKRAVFAVEYSDEVLGSDYHYTRYAGSLIWNFETFFKRRLFPNMLYIRATAGTFSGRLPLQKFGIVDVSEGIFSPFGALRTVRFHPYEGEQYAAVHVEHNFKTIPFELLGLDWVTDQNIGLIVFGSAAQTWISDSRMQQIINNIGYIPKITDGAHLEAGVSINGILNLFRVDFAWRIDEPAFLIGIGLTRFL